MEKLIITLGNIDIRSSFEICVEVSAVARVGDIDRFPITGLNVERNGMSDISCLAALNRSRKGRSDFRKRVKKYDSPRFEPGIPAGNIDNEIREGRENGQSWQPVAHRGQGC